MDPITILGAVASSLQIAALAQTVVKKSANAYVHFHEAPKELDSLKRNVSLLLNLVQRIQVRITRLSPQQQHEHRQPLFDSLLEAEQTISELLKESQEYVDNEQASRKRARVNRSILSGSVAQKCEPLEQSQHIHHEGVPRKRSRLKWAFVGSSAMDKCELRIRKTLDALNTILLVTMVESLDDVLLKQCSSIANQDMMINNQNAILGNQDIMLITTQKMQMDYANLVYSTDQNILHPCDLEGNKCLFGPVRGNAELAMAIGIDQRQILSSQQYTRTHRSASWLWYLGFLGSIVQRKGKSSRTFAVSTRYCLPRFLTRRPYLFMADFAFCVASDPWKVSGLYFNMLALNIVPDDAEIMVACRRGNLNLVRGLFKAKRASIYDVTPENDSLLYLSIEAGNADLVRFLLDEGADVNQTFGKYQTSALQWSLYLGMYHITRLLLNRNADGAHVSAWKGWNPLVYLLEGAQNFNGAQSHTLLDFLDALNHDRIHVDTEAQDDTGQNALQLAAAWYPGEVIQKLFNLGASLSPFGSNPWRYAGNPIWNAIDTNNTSAFRVLLPYYKDLDAVDRRHFRMVNYTARNGYVEMTNLLLEGGADEILPDYDINVDGEIKPVSIQSTEGSDAMDHDEEVYSDEDGEDGSEYDLRSTEGIEAWTRENYLKYMESLKRFGRISLRANDTDPSVDTDIFWNANE